MASIGELPAKDWPNQPTVEATHHNHMDQIERIDGTQQKGKEQGEELHPFGCATGNLTYIFFWYEILY